LPRKCVNYKTFFQLCLSRLKFKARETKRKFQYKLSCILKYFFLFLARQPPVGQGLLIHDFSRSHKTTHHSREDCSGRVISSSQRLLPTIHNTHNRQISMSTVGFETTVSEGERPQVYSLDRAATGAGVY